MFHRVVIAIANHRTAATPLDLGSRKTITFNWLSAVRFDSWLFVLRFKPSRIQLHTPQVEDTPSSSLRRALHRLPHTVAGLAAVALAPGPWDRRPRPVPYSKR